MFCEQCGAQLAETTQFCTNCGAAITAVSAPAAQEHTPPPVAAMPPTPPQPQYQAQPPYQPPPPQYAAAVPPDTTVPLNTAGPDFTADKGITTLKKLTGAAEGVLGLFFFLFVLLPKFGIDLSGTVVDIGVSYLMYGIMGVQSVFALIKGVQHKKILLIAVSIAVLPTICGCFLAETEEGVIFAFIFFFVFSFGSCFLTQKSFAQKKKPNPFSVNPQTAGGSVFSLNPEAQSAPVVLEGMCNLVEIHEQGEVFSGSKICKLQISPQCIRFVPNAFSRAMRGLVVFNTVMNIISGGLATGGDTFTAKDIREIPFTAITGIQKKKSLLEISAGDQFVYKFIGYGKVKQSYDVLMQLWNAARQTGYGN